MIAPDQHIRYGEPMIKDNSQNTNINTYFGREVINKQDKEDRVRAVFNSVASKYDLMNDIMSLGAHRIWKNNLIRSLIPQSNWSVLDVAGGTGDIAIRLAKKAQQRKNKGKITVCDINEAMMVHGRDNAVNEGLIDNIDWVAGNAEKLPFPDMHFDVYTIAFGLRNVTNIEVALQEAKRVLRPGGIFFCLEFSQVKNIALAKLYDNYSFSILPRIGKIVANNKGAYEYLVESIRRFPKQEELLNMIQDSGLRHVKYRNLSGGIAAIHSGWRL